MIKPEDTFLQEQIEVLGRDVVVPCQPSFGLIPKIFDAVDMVVFVGEKFAVIDSVMMKFVYVDGIVAFLAIGVDDRIWLDPRLRGDKPTISTLI